MFERLVQLPKLLCQNAQRRALRTSSDDRMLSDMGVDVPGRSYRLAPAGDARAAQRRS